MKAAIGLSRGQCADLLGVQGAGGLRDGEENEVGQNASCRVLVVDNYVSAAEALAEACSRYHEVKFVGGGSAAMEVALAWRPHVMILDIDMPSPNGLEVATMMRDIAHLQPVTLIAVTGRSAAFGQEEALAHGFDDYLTKPVDVEKLLALIAARRGPASADAEPA
ncbi:response regulator [Pigmentiphaga sp.]|uniref:response regulator n=1 Tax=Pigmentiphaga sp. TaxID=1977564 RepID=UPI0025CE503C|nr:response regulator [Pigmentiphaga sp.]MBX6320059.1 response regulator [Pigmentiphaga sp.]